MIVIASPDQSLEKKSEETERPRASFRGEGRQLLRQSGGMTVKEGYTDAEEEEDEEEKEVVVKKEEEEEEVR